ncbi:MAG: flagellar basal body protein [Defluviitaleaceae bacterium]|nr:flagellar basal body protein [Defluviitaleaceae bacterium]
MPLNSIHRTTSGLQAAQRNLAVTAHNMANVSTLGFSRQRVNQVEFAHLNIGRTASSTNQVGLGTSIVGIQQLRNQFMDMHFRNEIGSAHFFETMHRTANDVEMSMDELSNTSNGLVVTRNLWASIQELSLDPGAMDTRSNFVSSATTFLNRMNDTHRRLTEQQNTLNNQAMDLIRESNQLLHTIDDLNKRIHHMEISGQAANDFRDARNVAMDRLAAILDVDFRTNSRNGHVEISTNGHTLLGNNQITHIGMRFTEENGNFIEPVIGQDVTPDSGILNFDPSFRNANSLMRLDRTPMSWDRPGELMGTIMSRGLSRANHVSIHSVFERYAQNPNAGQPLPPPAIGVQPDFIPDANGMFLKSPDGDFMQLTTEEMAIAQTQWELRNEFSNTQSVIPRTLRRLDTMFNHTIAMINEFLTNANASSTNTGTWGTYHRQNWTDIASNATSAQLYDPPYNRTVNAWGGTGIPIFVTVNNSHIDTNGLPANVNEHTANYTLGNVVINPALLTPDGFNLIGLQANNTDVSSPHILLNLLSTWHENLISIDGSAPAGIDDFYNFMVTNLAVETESLNNFADSHARTISEIEGERHRSFGVSLEEEMTNMIRFQHSFNASARVVNVLTEMIDTLINRTGRL